MDISRKNYFDVGNYVSIPEFYSGRSVFITEADSFSGRLLIEKLLRSCPDFENIYVLIKPQGGEDIQKILERVVFRAPIFSQHKPQDLKKVIPIKGDIMLKFFGMTLEDLELLKDKVSVILHSSFIYRSSESLKVAVERNLLPVKELIRMCHWMNKLDALVYLSAISSNWHQQVVHEVAYPPPYEPSTIISMAQNLSDEFLAKLEPLLLNEIKPMPIPNTFTFTKALSEAVILQDGAGIPRSIVRPSVLISCANEPIKGFIDHWTISAQYISIIGRGLKNSLYGDNKVTMDLIPGDMVTNMTLAAAWNTALNKYPFVPVFNISSGSINPLTAEDFIAKLIPQFVRKYPIDGAVWYPSIKLIKNRQIDQLRFAMTHYLPAYIGDKWNRIVRGRESNLVKSLVEIRNQYRDYDWMVRRPQNYQSKNPEKLMRMMSKSDREKFPFDVRTINWTECIENYVYGVRKFLCNQDDSVEALEKGRKRIARLKLLDRSVKAATFLVGFAIVGSSINYAMNRKKE